MAEYALEVMNLTSDVKNIRLRDINFRLEPGYIMGLIGTNGAGKTTLLLSLLGLYGKRKGEIRIGGYDLEKQGKEAKDQIGFVLDESPFLEGISARDNAKIYGRYYTKWDQNLFDRYCKEFDIDQKKSIKKLSKGTKVKFQLAFALSHEAKLLVLDEPAAGLDPVFRKELIEIMCDVISEGDKSILFSTHLTEELDKVADYITLLHQGKQIFSLSKEEMMERYAIVKGSKEQIKKIEPTQLVGMRVNENHTEALIIRDDILIPGEIQCLRPTIEDILYYTANGCEKI